MGGCQGWVRGPRGVVRVGQGDQGGSSGVGEGIMGGCQEHERGPWRVDGSWVVIPGGRRPPIGAEGPQLAKRACRPQGRENEGA